MVSQAEEAALMPLKLAGMAGEGAPGDAVGRLQMLRLLGLRAAASAKPRG